MKILMTGSSGLIGTALTGALEARGDEVIRLVRRPARSGGELSWDPHAERGGVDPAAIAGAGAAVNLAGEPVAGGRWTTARKQRIMDSRRSTTRALSGLLTALDEPPAVLLSGSAMGFYGDTGGREVDESSPSGSGFLPDVVRQWEAAAEPAAAAGIRVVYLRTGLVMSARGGLLWPAAAAVPGRARRADRPGTQWMSWIMLADWVRIACYLLDKPALSGPGQPDRAAPVHQRRVHRCAGGCGRSPGTPVAARDGAAGGSGRGQQRALSSARVVPRRLLDTGEPACGRPGPRSGPRWRPSSADPARYPALRSTG
jgi:uncharacterized protein (TIGR01777 family)